MITMRRSTPPACLAVGCLVLAATAIGTPHSSGELAPATDAVGRGRYLVLITGCNDCHTERFPERGGQVPESEWLTGSSLGYRGAWGTTYGTNLRLYVQGLSEDDWVTVARESESRPPMPWWGMRSMSDEDLRAMYAFIRGLGPAGEEAPAYLPPDRQPPPPYVAFPQ